MYSQLRKAHLETTPRCQVCGALGTDIHHKEGRGSKTNDPTTWLVVCRSCHQYIHEHPSWARSHNYLK